MAVSVPSGGFGTAAAAASGNVSPAYPSVSGGILANDIILCFVATRDGTTFTSGSITGSFTLKQTQIVTGNAATAALFWKRAAGSESGTETVTHSGGNAIIAAMVVLRGAYTSGDPFDGIGSFASTVDAATPTTADSITPTYTNGWLGAYCYGVRSTSGALGTFSDETGYTGQTQQSGGASGNRIGFRLYEKDSPPTGGNGSGATDFDWGGTLTHGNAIHFALRAESPSQDEDFSEPLTGTMARIASSGAMALASVTAGLALACATAHQDDPAGSLASLPVEQDPGWSSVQPITPTNALRLPIGLADEDFAGTKLDEDYAWWPLRQGVQPGVPSLPAGDDDFAAPVTIVDEDHEWPVPQQCVRTSALWLPVAQANDDFVLTAGGVPGLQSGSPFTGYVDVAGSITAVSTGDAGTHGSGTNVTSSTAGLVIATVTLAVGSGTSPTVTSITGGGSNWGTWTFLTRENGRVSGRLDSEIWYCVTTGAVNGVVTANIGGSASNGGVLLSVLCFDSNASTTPGTYNSANFASGSITLDVAVSANSVLVGAVGNYSSAGTPGSYSANVAASWSQAFTNNGTCAAGAFRTSSLSAGTETVSCTCASCFNANIVAVEIRSSGGATTIVDEDHWEPARSWPAFRPSAPISDDDFVVPPPTQVVDEDHWEPARSWPAFRPSALAADDDFVVPPHLDDTPWLLGPAPWPQRLPPAIVGYDDGYPPPPPPFAPDEDYRWTASRPWVEVWPVQPARADEFPPEIPPFVPNEDYRWTAPQARTEYWRSKPVPTDEFPPQVPTFVPDEDAHGAPRPWRMAASTLPRWADEYSQPPVVAFAPEEYALTVSRPWRTTIVLFLPWSDELPAPTAMFVEDTPWMLRVLQRIPWLRDLLGSEELAAPIVPPRTVYFSRATRREDSDESALQRGSIDSLASKPGSGDARSKAR